MYSSKSIKLFDGSEMTLKEGSKYFEYLKQRFNMVKNQELNIILKQMSGIGTIRVSHGSKK